MQRYRGQPLHALRDYKPRGLNRFAGQAEPLLALIGATTMREDFPTLLRSFRERAAIRAHNRANPRNITLVDDWEHDWPLLTGEPRYGLELPAPVEVG
jgi:hypothetical protein